MIDKPEPVPVFYVKKSPENFDAYQKQKTGFLTHIFQVWCGIKKVDSLFSRIS